MRPVAALPPLEFADQTIGQSSLTSRAEKMIFRASAFARHLSNVTPLSETGAVPPVVAGDLREWPENLARGLNAPRATAAKLRTAAGRHLGEGSALPVGKLKDHLFQDAEVIAVFAPDESSSRNKTVTLST